MDYLLNDYWDDYLVLDRVGSEVHKIVLLSLVNVILLLGALGIVIIKI